MAFSEDEHSVVGACFAYSMQRRNSLKPNTRLAYYTTADTALRLIQNKTFWLRNPRLMNDYSEVVLGQQCLDAVLRDADVISRASQTVDLIIPGFFKELAERWCDHLRSDHALPFVACLSEIDVSNNRGRLSMWRAYGGCNGVALVMRDNLLDLESDFINTFHSPVLYGGSAEVKLQLIGILERLAGAAKSVDAAGKEFLAGRLLNAFEFAMLSVKHVGFEEEKEWRMIHHLSGPSPHLTYRSQVVRGNAEVVCELNLASHAALAPAAMIEKVIIGPCTFPYDTAQAIALAFETAGGGIPEIVPSDIPLRHF